MIDIAKFHNGAEPRNGQCTTIAIDGRGASGKSTLALFLGTALDGFTVINGDDFFESHDDEIIWGEFNEERFRNEVLFPVNLGRREFTIRPFDFPQGELGPPKHLSINRGVIIERCFSFKFPIEWDIRIWVETPKKICLERGLKREGAKVLSKRATAAWTQIWQPRESHYIAKSSPRQIADYVVDGTQPFEDAEWLPRSAQDRNGQ
ncbi:MAG: hypothetical protein WA090_03105 [Candidatus Nanopelagicaceae bacterium]